MTLLGAPALYYMLKDDLRDEVVNMTCRGGDHASNMLDRVEPTGRTVELVLAKPT